MILNEEYHLHLQLGHFDTTALTGEMISIPPLSLKELRAINHNLSKLHTSSGVNVTSDDVNASIQTEYKGSVLLVQDEISASEEDLARGRDGDGGVLEGHFDGIYTRLRRSRQTNGIRIKTEADIRWRKSRYR